MPEQNEDLQAYDDYVSRLFAPEDDALRGALEQMKREDIPSIQVTASQGKLLHLLALMTGARRILEIGTLGGYSTIWLARALPAGGRLISLELEPRHAEASRRSIECAGLADKVEVRVGPASESLAAMAKAGEPAFDLVFIDADKDGYPKYLDLSFPLTRPGGLILADNTLSRGVLDPATDNGITRYNAAAAAHPGLTSVIVPALKRGVDGLLISVKTG